MERQGQGEKPRSKGRLKSSLGSRDEDALTAQSQFPSGLDRTPTMGISLELEAKEAPPAPIPNPLLGPENQKLLRKRSSCPNLKMYVKDQHGQVTGIDVDLSPPIGVDVEASFIEEKCCFLVPSGFMSGKKGARRSSAEGRF